MTGFFNWLRGNSWDGANWMRSVCLPGIDRKCGVGPRDRYDWVVAEGATELGVSIPDAGVDAREEVVLDIEGSGPCPLASFGAAFATGAGFLAPHAEETVAAARGFGPAPNEGKASSDLVSIMTSPDLVGPLALTGSSFAFCFPAALSAKPSDVG